MKIDLCKLLGVEEGEKFKLKLFGTIGKYRLKNGKMEYYDDFINKWVESTISMNHILDSDIIKLPKKKEFSQDTLNFFKLVDKRYEWVAKDKNECAWLFKEKPFKLHDIGKWDTNNCNVYNLAHICCNQSLFDQILWEDEEPVYIDDYVER